MLEPGIEAGFPQPEAGILSTETPQRCHNPCHRSISNTHLQATSGKKYVGLLIVRGGYFCDAFVAMVRRGIHLSSILYGIWGESNKGCRVNGRASNAGKEKVLSIKFVRSSSKLETVLEKTWHKSTSIIRRKFIANRQISARKANSPPNPNGKKLALLRSFHVRI